MNKRVLMAGGVVAVILAGAAVYFAFRPEESRPAGDGGMAVADVPPAHPSLLYGRVTTVDGAVYEGRLRWGGSQEAFWGDYFNGAKKSNPWAAHVPAGRLPVVRDPFTLFGFEIFSFEEGPELNRLFMARFGDLARIEGGVRDVRVTLKSGTVFDLSRSEASDFDDGLMVWDRIGDSVKLDSLRVRAIEFLDAPEAGPAPDRLHGIVHTRAGRFSGFIQWDRTECLGSDLLTGRGAKGEVSLRFSDVRSIAPRSATTALVTLRDGREIALSGSRHAGEGHRGIYVDDPRYGRVLVSREAFTLVELVPGGEGPAYGDFPPGGTLSGTVTTRDGRSFAGRLVFDLDESEFTETLDAPAAGVDYTIPFGLVASIVMPDGTPEGGRGVTVVLHGGESLVLERDGDLGPRNGGLLIFAERQTSPEYVGWAEVRQVRFNRPKAMFPAIR